MKHERHLKGIDIEKKKEYRARTQTNVPTMTLTYQSPNTDPHRIRKKGVEDRGTDKKERKAYISFDS